MAKAQLSWNNLDMDNMSKPVKAAWDAMQAAKEKFEAEVIKGLKKAGHVPDGKVVKFAYRHGIGFAVADESEARQNIAV